MHTRQWISPSILCCFIKDETMPWNKGAGKADAPPDMSVGSIFVMDPALLCFVRRSTPRVPSPVVRQQCRRPLLRTCLIRYRYQQFPQLFS